MGSKSDKDRPYGGGRSNYGPFWINPIVLLQSGADAMDINVDMDGEERLMIYRAE